METRVKELEEQVVKLRIADGRLSTNIEMLTTTVSTLNTSVTKLNSTMERGRGAIWAICTLAAFISGVGTWIVTVFTHNK